MGLGCYRASAPPGPPTAGWNVSPGPRPPTLLVTTSDPLSLPPRSWSPPGPPAPTLLVASLGPPPPSCRSPLGPPPPSPLPAPLTAVCPHRSCCSSFRTCPPPTGVTRTSACCWPRPTASSSPSRTPPITTRSEAGPPQRAPRAGQCRCCRLQAPAGEEERRPHWSGPPG